MNTRFATLVALSIATAAAHQQSDAQTAGFADTRRPLTSGVPAAAATPAGVSASLRGQGEHSGVLKLRAHPSSSQSATIDIKSRLMQHQSVLEASLAAHFSFTSVRVLSIVQARQRLAETGYLDVHFAGKGPAASLSPAAFENSLQKALSAANSGLTITEAEIEWNIPPPPPFQVVLVNFVRVVMVVACALAVLACAWGLDYCVKMIQRDDQVTMDHDETAATELLETVDARVFTKAYSPDKKIADDASTGSPESDLQTLLDDDSA